MINYNFESLSSYDFEVFTRDLLQEHLNMYFDNFKSGRDGGIDLRSSISEDKTLIVQCKHYVNSTYANLISELKKEAKKLFILRPNRYIVVTSQGLTQKNKEEIKGLFEPFINSTEDIFSRDNLNNLLSQYPKIERQHYKLWLSSQNVLDRIMHNEVFNKSEIALENMKKRISLYVQNKSYFTAKEILSEINYCIIAGTPGIGKTTLADMLIIDYLANDYEMYKITNISEALRVYHPHKKQVFYYDDFLGQTSLDLKLNNREDEDILQFITTVNKENTTKFILTTREYILNQAKSTYEKLANSNFDIRKCVIDLTDYTKLDKAQILYNHLYFSELPMKLIVQLLNNGNYMKIIDHPNYSPRIIERMTLYYDSQEVQTNYIDDFLSNLDNPLRIWDHAFNHQLSNVARNLLLVMASMPAVTIMSDLFSALKSFEDVSGEKGSFKDFRQALKELEGNFININRVDNDYILSYNNPSIKDFIEYHLADNLIEFSYLCKSLVFFEQSVTIRNFESSKEAFGPLILKCLHDFIESMEKNFKSDPLQVAHTRIPYYRKINKVPISYFDRFLYVLSLSTSIPGNQLKGTLNRLEQEMFEIINSNYHENFNFSIFLKRIKNQNYQSIIGESVWVQLFKNILYQNLEDFFSYDILIEILNTNPEEFKDSEVSELRLFFNDFHKSDVLYNLDNVTDSNELDGYISVLNNVSDILEIDVEDLMEEIGSRMKRFEDETDYDDERWRDYDRNRTDINNNDEIDSLFDSLKQ